MWHEICEMIEWRAWKGLWGKYLDMPPRRDHACGLHVVWWRTIWLGMCICTPTGGTTQLEYNIADVFV